MSSEEIKFPFEPNEKVKAAFRQQRQMKAAVQLMTEALAEVAASIKEPFYVLAEEHPELREYRWTGLSYNHLTEELDIKNKH